MLRRILLLFFVFLGYIIVAQEVTIVPRPFQVRLEEGVFVYKGDLQYQTYGIESEDLITGLNQLKKELADRRSIELKAGMDAQLHIGIPSRDDVFSQLCGDFGVTTDNALGKQGYVLKIGPDQIILAGQTAQGLFYGIQSLKQLIRGSAKDGISCMFIYDKPVLEYRGVMDDISRGPVPTHDYLKYQIRRLSELKINLFSFYIEHVVRTEKHPEFAPANGGISIEEWRELSDYAANYHVQLVGNFQSLGHFEQILSHPKYRHLGASSRMLFPGSEESIQFLSDVYTEMAPAFSSSFFNINCDEIWDLGRGSTKELVDSLGIARVYANHINELHEVLKKNGKQMTMWGDIVLAHPEIFELIPEETIIMTWDYSAYDSFASFIDPIIASNFRFMVCPGVLNSNRLFPDLKSARINIRNFVSEGAEKGAMGALLTVWDDGGVHSFNRDWYGVAYGADQAWNPGEYPVEQFDQSLAKGIYGDTNDFYFRSLHEIMLLDEISTTHELNSLVFHNTMIPRRGERITYNMNDWYNVLQVVDRADSLLNLCRFSTYQDEPRFTRFTLKQYRYMAEGRTKLLQAAQDYAEASRTQFQNQNEAGELLLNAHRMIAECRRDFQNLKTELMALWDAENRPYWKNYALDHYNQVLADYADLEQSFSDAVSLFEIGEAIPFPKDIRLDIGEQSNDYFLYWLLCGPFPIENETGDLPDFLQELNGEKNARPIPGLSFKALSGETFSWSKYSSPVIDRIDLKTVYSPNTQVLAYAYCTIETMEDHEVIASLGSNDGITVYCNGQQVHHIRTKRDVVPDEDRCVLPLKKGKNHILLKVDNWKGGWGFSFRLLDFTVRNHKQKYKIVQ